MQLVSAKSYFVVLGYETGSQRVARLENRILGQLKMGEHQPICGALGHKIVFKWYQSSHWRSSTADLIRTPVAFNL